MRHPLDFLPPAVRRRLFLALLAWTLFLFGVFQILDRPLETGAAPRGIVSFELAGTAQHAQQMLQSWSAPGGRALNYAAFGLGLDYLFMPSYAATIALGVLLASGRHGGPFAALGPWLGWASLAAALFDATENFALWQLLAHGLADPWPLVAFWCASFKFGLILLGMAYALGGALLPGAARAAK